MVKQYRGFYIDKEIDYVSVSPVEAWDTMYPPNIQTKLLRTAVVREWNKTQAALLKEGKFGTITQAKKTIDRIIKENAR